MDVFYHKIGESFWRQNLRLIKSAKVFGAKICETPVDYKISKTPVGEFAAKISETPVDYKISKTPVGEFAAKIYELQNQR
jgi:hypothetical protein